MTKKLKIRVPGSSGNVGPGFDTLALALKVFLHLTFEIDENISEGPKLEFKGDCIQGLVDDRSNLIVRVMEAYLNSNGGDSDSLKNLKITVENDIPLARGLGSSSAASIGAAWGAQWLMNEDFDLDACIQHVAEKEGHGENSAASAEGGLVTVCKTTKGDYEYLTSSWPDCWSTIVVVPGHEISTPEAREVLPRTVGMEQTVKNIQNTAMLISAVLSEDSELLKLSLNDCIHEPYRSSLVPELSSLKAALRNGPTLGVVLSGAGSSILTIVHRNDKEDVLKAINTWKTKGFNNAEVLDLEVDHDGLVVEIV